MEERQIIAQLKQFRQLKPNEEWREAAKSRILGPSQPQENLFSGVFSLPFRRGLRLQPVMIAPLLIVIVVGVAIFAHFYLGSSEEIAELPYESQVATYLVLAETKLGQLDNLEPKDIEEVAEILRKAAESISLAPKDPAETAKIVESVANINKKVKALGIEELNLPAQTLVSKTGEFLEENIEDTTKDLVDNLIKMLRTKSLTEEQKELFKEIQLDYNDGSYPQALEKILILTNNQENQ